MSRKQFIESQGATCKNWIWSWSFINEAEKVIIFGAWSENEENNRTLILRDEWKTNGSGRSQPGYTQALEHIRLVEKEGYTLKTFPMVYSETTDENGVSRARIEEFTPELTVRKLTAKELKKEKVGDGNDESCRCWYAEK